VEIWFSILEGKSLHGASFTSVKQLGQHIDAFIEATTKTPSRLSGLKPEFTSVASKAAVSVNCDSGYESIAQRFSAVGELRKRRERLPSVTAAWMTPQEDCSCAEKPFAPCGSQNLIRPTTRNVREASVARNL
jgi:hypothetical protein